MAKPEKSSIVHYVAIALSLISLCVALMHILLSWLKVLLPVLAAWWIWHRYRTFHKSQQDALNAVFYQLIQVHQGHVTVLDFAMAAKITAIAARQYLDDRAKDFSAHFEVTEQGDVVYVFRSLKWLPQASQAVTPTSVVACKQVMEPLTQAQLARRLGVSANTVRRKKFSPSLIDWSRSRDPDNIGWSYLAQAQRFFPFE